MIRYFKSASHPATLIWLTLALLFCWSQSPLGLSVMAAALGASLGTVAAFLLKNVRIPIWRLLLISLGAMVATNAVTDLVRWLSLPSLILGGPLVYRLSDAAFWGVETFLSVFLLRWLANRKPSFVTLELFVAGGIVVNLFAAHRDGFLNRPHGIVDPLWARGIDPMPVFLAFGLAVSGVLLALAATHSEKRGRWIDVVGITILLGCLFLVAPLEHIKELQDPKSRSSLQDSKPYAKAGASGQSQEDAPSTGPGQAQGDRAEDKPSESDPSPGEKSGEGSNSQSGEPTSGPGQTPGGQSQTSSGEGQGESQQDQAQQGEQNQQDSDQDQHAHDKSPNAGQGGNSDEPSFSDAQSSPSSDPPVAVVVFRDDYTPESGMYYFRQEAFSEYNGTKLVTDSTGQFDRDTAQEYPGSQPLRPHVPKVDSLSFKKLETRVALIKDHSKPFGLTNSTQWRATQNPDPKRFQRAYEVSSLVLDRPFAELIDQQIGDPSWRQETWAHYTNSPNDPRYHELLKKISHSFPDAPQDDPLIKALMIKLWLEENGIYSLNSRHGKTDDPTADFLFGDLTGYCVYFAHAAVYLYRSAGLPARIGSGYAVEASQRGNGSSLLIPASAAHAWPEVYLQDLGWVVLDISPQKSLEQAPSPVDQGLQQMMGEMARQNPDEDPIDPAEEKLDIQEAAREAAQAFGAGLPWVLLAAILGTYIYKAYRRYLPRFCSQPKYPSAAFRSLLDALCDLGWVRETGEPRAVFARRVAELSPAFGEFTSYHLRHGLGDPASKPNYPWEETYERAKLEIGRNLTRERVWKGVLNPVNWIKVH